jgi:leukotriene-A4 hydrolase
MASDLNARVIANLEGQVAELSTENAALAASQAERAFSRIERTSYSNATEVTARTLVLDLAVDFEAQTLSGTATTTFEVLVPGVTTIVLDTRELAIRSVAVDGAAAAHELAEHSEAFGSRLTVTLPAAAAAPAVGATLSLTIAYATAPTSSACQWLPPAQTAGKARPYLFTQCQAIHARSLLPCQDTPGSKMSYGATLRVPGWSRALMSAPNSSAACEAVAAGPSDAADGTKVFAFEQPVPVSAYLIAIAVGDLESRRVGPRSHVWSEPSMVEAVAYEFAETEAFIAAGEAILGQPYVWGNYDILCLPPSFPYGGMENPCLTFVTPTLLARDRSLADVVAHEIAHSWTGNLVTNHTWEHFWLNEGWTMWVQRKIMAKVHDDPLIFDFDAETGWKALLDSVEDFGDDPQGFTSLVPALEGCDPDDAFSSVPYERGFNLLFELTKVCGGHAPFEAFAKAYIARFKYKTLTSGEFRVFYEAHFAGQGVDVAGKVDWDAWFYGTGMPPCGDPGFDTTLSAAALALKARWCAADGSAGDGCSGADIAGWSSDLKVNFLEKLLVHFAEAPMSAALVAKLDAAYDLSATFNSEIRFRFQMLAVPARHAPILEHVRKFVTEQGRMKFVRPLYKKLFGCGWPEAKELALSTFKANRTFYHPIAAKMLAKDLGV